MTRVHICWHNFYVDLYMYKRNKSTNKHSRILNFIVHQKTKPVQPMSNGIDVVTVLAVRSSAGQALSLSLSLFYCLSLKQCQNSHRSKSPLTNTTVVSRLRTPVTTCNARTCICSVCSYYQKDTGNHAHKN